MGEPARKIVADPGLDITPKNLTAERIRKTINKVLAKEGAFRLRVYLQTCAHCGLCAEACSMQHYGVINKDFARIYVRKVLTPMPKAVIAVCTQCHTEERPCEKACPVSPPAIYYDEKTQHMV